MRKLSINTLVSLLMQVLLVSMLPYLMYRRNYIYAAAAVLAIIIAYTPAMMRKNFNIQLPWFLEFSITLMLFLHVGGLAFHWYSRFRFYDSVLHIWGTIIIALLGFMMVYTLYYLDKVHLSLRMIALFTFFFTLSIGALWEIAEFTTDHFLHTHAQLGNQDTMSDLIFDGIGGTIVALLGMWYVRKTPERKINQQIARLLNRNL